MTKYDIPVWKMCEEAAKDLPEIFSPIDVIRKIKEKRPDVKESTISTYFKFLGTLKDIGKKRNMTARQVEMALEI